VIRKVDAVESGWMDGIRYHLYLFFFLLRRG
jgi:hypothetical protein